ncbi:MAG: T3SS effector HopA1 family protein [Scytonema sp. PMC 1069.18]|nr:T3SS effector HopA1 family protein [Scytonema sp. PMC 1069.18]MEC4888266.1 T3SS effector HopA1 family protein [Scytonema sp. PMC 1070.18]
MLQTTTEPLLNSLLDIVNNIQIESNFCISHPEYHPFSLPAKIAARFQQTSLALQQKYLSLLLRNFLHGIYYNGSLQTILTPNGNRINYSQHKSLETNSIFGIDLEFYEQLHANNHGTGYFDPGWFVLRQEPDGSMAVSKGGLTLYIESNNHLEPAMKSAKAGEVISIWMPKNRLYNGFYIAVSNTGQDLQVNLESDLGLGRIYFNVTSVGAIALMESLTLQLNAAAIPFSFHVLHNPVAYGRYDSGVLYFECEDYPAVRKVLQPVYELHQSHFHNQIPLFTKFLAPGLGLAEEPTQKFAPQENFGMNRCQIVANALLEVWQKGSHSVEQRMRAIHQHFAQFGIDLQRPYLNPSSEDIYEPLNKGL